MRSHFELPAKLALLYQALAWLREQLGGALLNDKEKRRLELAVEEIFVNIVSHAYGGREGTVELTLEVFPADHLELTVSDSGPPFNPLTLPPVEVVSPEKEGGLGIHLMKQCVDEIRYARSKEKNTLHLIKRFSRRK